MLNEQERRFFMAVVKCPECKGTVSEYAANCPHCGFLMSLAKNSNYQTKNSLENISKSGDPKAASAASAALRALRGAGLNI